MMRGDRMRMGVRSRPVLDLLGFDMRTDFQWLLSDPPPEHLRHLLHRFAAETVRLPRVEDGPTV
jgi:hypothetical protein